MDQTPILSAFPRDPDRRGRILVALGVALMLAALVQAGFLGYSFVNAFWAPTPTILDLPYRDFLTQVADGNVAWVSIVDNAGLHIEGALRQAITL